MALPLPVLNLHDTPEPQLVQQLREACFEHGFFLVTGHGVPQPLISSTLQALQSFFALPAAVKATLQHNVHAKGYMCWGQQTLDLGVQTCGDTKETWAVMDPSLSVSAEHPDAFSLPFHSPNQWPDPADLPGFREVVEELVGRMKGVRDRVNQLLAQVLDQPPEFFEPFFNHQPLDMLRGFHYHCEAGSDPDKGVFGAGAHTDWGHLTYLMTDGCPGLQIHHAGTWHDVPHVPGAFVCNIADLLQLWSGGRFKSTMHRVVVAPGVHRYSCAYFTVPSWNAWVQPLAPATAAMPPAISAPATGGTKSAGSSGDAVRLAEGTASSNADAAAPAAEQVSKDSDLACDQACVVLVTANGCSLAPGASGVRVVDYIQAKYKFHFQDAGKMHGDKQ